MTGSRGTKAWVDTKTWGGWERYGISALKIFFWNLDSEMWPT